MKCAPTMVDEVDFLKHKGTNRYGGLAPPTMVDEVDFLKQTQVSFWSSSHSALASHLL